MLSYNNAKNNSSLATYYRLVKYAKEYYLYLVLGLVATLLSSAIDAAIAYSIAPLIDDMSLSNPWLFKVLPVIVVIIFITRAALSFVSDYLINLTGYNIVLAVRKELFLKTMSLPASLHDRKSNAEILTNITTNSTTISAATTDIIITVVRDGSLAIFLLCVMLAISWQLTFMCLLIAPFIALMVRYSSRRMRTLSHEMQQTVSSMIQVVSQSSMAYKIVYIFGTKNKEIARFDHAATRNKHMSVKVQVSNAVASAAIQAAIAIPLAAGLMMVGKSKYAITIGGFATVVIAMGRLLGPIKSLTKINAPIQTAIAAATKIFSLLDSEEEEDQGVFERDRVKGDIEIKNISFAYSELDRVVLQNISLQIKSGETVAFVGSSGSGKTSIINLLPRLYKVSSGEIRIDGVNINSYSLANLRSHFSYVGQDIKLFSGSIYENIIYGCDEKPSKEQFKQALLDANISEFLAVMPDGIDTIIGDNGVLLSGGQRQRIAIARALLKDAPILILDEATSALDSKTEKHIQVAIEKLQSSRTSILIAHRLSTIINVDCIYVLENGKIVEFGSHKDLLRRNGKYSSLYNIQFQKED